MTEAFWIALMQLAAKIGLNATIELLSNRGATLDDAIAALRRAQAKSLEDYITEDAAKRALQPPAPVPPPGMVATSGEA